MRLHVSLRSGVPIYVQLVGQIRQMVASGRLPIGSELPTIRALAEELLINPNTVARAYRELEQAGLVTSRRGTGTRVTDTGSPLARSECERMLLDRIQSLLMEAAHLGFSFDEMTALMEQYRGTAAVDGPLEDKKESVHE